MPLLRNEELHWLQLRVVLRHQAGMSIAQRCQHFQQRWHRPIKRHQLRKYYGVLGITQQKLACRVGPPRFVPWAEQEAKL